MMNPIHKLADALRSLRNRGEEVNPYEEDDDLFTQDFSDEDTPPVREKTKESQTEEPPKKKKWQFRLPSFHRQPKPISVEPKEKEKKGDTGKDVTRKKKRLIFASLLLVIAAGFSYFFFFADDGFTPNPQQKPATVATTQKPKDQKKQEAAASAQVAAANIPVNPFVDVTLLKKEEREKVTNAAAANRSGVHTGSLPSIPSQSSTRTYTAPAPRPSLPSIPSPKTLPAMPGGMPQAPTETPKEVQGVITGEDGSNMAIMGDGTIVSEGETYNDGRIAYIGGDGIKFDDGSTLEYK